jgi:hypothetical protein
MSTEAKGVVASGTPAFVEKKIVGDILTLTFGNKKVLEFDVSKLPAKQVQNLKMHGASQKYGDVAAKYTKERDFAGAIAHTEALWNANLNDNWTMKAVPVPKEIPPTVEELVIAFGRIMKLKPDAAQAGYDALPAEFKAQLPGLPDVAADVKQQRLDADKKALAGAPSNLASLMAQAKAAAAAPATPAA